MAKKHHVELDQDERYFYALGRRVRLNKKDNCFEIEMHNMFYRIYPSEFTQMIEMATENGMMEFCMMVPDPKKHGNHGVLQMYPKMKWVG